MIKLFAGFFHNIIIEEYCCFDLLFYPLYFITVSADYMYILYLLTGIKDSVFWRRVHGRSVWSHAKKVGKSALYVWFYPRYSFSQCHLLIVCVRMSYRRQKRWWNAYILFYERLDVLDQNRTIDVDRSKYMNRIHGGWGIFTFLLELLILSNLTNISAQ